MNHNQDIKIPNGVKTYTIQKVTGDNAGEDYQAVFTENRFITHILHEDCIEYPEDNKGKRGAPIIKAGAKLRLRDRYKGWMLITDIKKEPEGITGWIDIAIEKEWINKRGAYYFYGKENIGRKKSELNLSNDNLLDIQKKYKNG